MLSSIANVYMAKEKKIRRGMRIQAGRIYCVNQYSQEKLIWKVRRILLLQLVSNKAKSKILDLEIIIIQLLAVKLK